MRESLLRPEVQGQVSPGFYFQRCLPIWHHGLQGTLRDRKADALTGLDPNARGDGARILGDPALYKGILDRQAHTFRVLRQTLDGVELRLRNLSPFVTGIGQPHPLENGFAFLKPYGIPYLAGSGVKGAVRAACTLNWKEEEKVGREDCEQRLLHYFGSEDKDAPPGPRVKHVRGALICLDLLPEVESCGDVFRLDIVNPHYAPYYQGKDVPADWHSPIPSFFLTLRPGIQWHLRILYAPPDPQEGRPHWLAEVMPGLKAALTLEGLGAKKSWGYGLFTIDGVGAQSPPSSSLAQEPAPPRQAPAEAGVKAEPPAIPAPERSPHRTTLERMIKALKSHEVKARFQGIAAQILGCPVGERGELIRTLREHLAHLGMKPREINQLFEKHPHLLQGEGG
jgi:CRISPR-associated protein Cmr6